MTEPQRQQVPDNNNELLSDNSYIHKKFKKVAALNVPPPLLEFPAIHDNLVKPPRKRSSNSFSFEAVHQPQNPSFETATPDSSDRHIVDQHEITQTSVVSVIQIDTVDSNVGLKLHGRAAKFGIRDIIQLSSVENPLPPTVSASLHESNSLCLDSQRKRCISEGFMAHPFPLKPKHQKLDVCQYNDNSAIKNLLLNNQVSYADTSRDPSRRSAVDFSINGLMKPTMSQNHNMPLDVKTFHHSSLLNHHGGESSNSAPIFSQCSSGGKPGPYVVNSSAPGHGPNVSFSVANSVMYYQEVPRHQVQSSIVDLSARRKEVMSRGLPLASSYQFVNLLSPKEDRSKTKKDDSPRVSRELKFHNYTVDSVPYLISPTKSRVFIGEKPKDTENSFKESNETKKFPRPTSLSLKPGSFQQKKVCMSGIDATLGVPKFQDGGHILISPDTPRPSKAYNQTFLNGYSYTTLGLKCSTRVYFCCLSKPQPMYVVQETDPKLSMYSQWQIRPSAIDLSQSGLSPVQFLTSYDSRQRLGTYTNANSKYLPKMVVAPSKIDAGLKSGHLVETKDTFNHAVVPQSKPVQLTEIHDNELLSVVQGYAEPEVSLNSLSEDIDPTSSTDDDSSDIDPGEASDSPLDMTKKRAATPHSKSSGSLNQIEFYSSEGEGERQVGSSPVNGSEDGRDLNNDDDDLDGAEDDVNVKTECDDESLDQLSDRNENLEVPCSSKDDPDGFDSFYSEGSPESLVRRITDNIKSGRKTIGRGSSPPYNVCDGEGRSTCHFCQKVFSRASQLRLHINIHYLERQFKCADCGVSFRNKGHLKKHLQSAIHLTKVNKNGTFGVPSEENPRPFKCADCLVAFRIHGHLAKHLRSKSHIMKLECNGKLPFGTYAEIERSGINVNEIDTTDCQNTLDSLKALIVQRFGRLQRERRINWDANTSSS